MTQVKGVFTGGVADQSISPPAPSAVHVFHFHTAVLYPAKKCISITMLNLHKKAAKDVIR